MSLATLLEEIRNDVRTVPGIRRVYDTVPDSVNEMPAIIVAAMGGRCWIGSHSSALHCEHDLRLEVHIARKDLAADAATMTAIAPEVARHLYSGFVRDRFNGTMVTSTDPRGGAARGMLDYTVGPSEYAGQQTYAMLCDFRVMTEEEVIP